MAYSRGACDQVAALCPLSRHDPKLDFMLKSNLKIHAFKRRPSVNIPHGQSFISDII